MGRGGNKSNGGNGDTQQGTVKRLVRDRGFGFIKTDSGKDEYFFHRSAVVPHPTAFDSMNEGDSVSFTVEQSDKGPRAGNVSVS